MSRYVDPMNDGLQLLRRELAAADRSWVTRARCRGMNPAAFFPERGEPTDQARAVCATCPVTEECLEFGRKFSIRDGIWGGTTGNDRRGTGRRAQSTCGSTTGYEKGCRCEPCRRAHAAYMVEYRARRSA